MRFIADGLASTRVELEHRGFERHGAGAAALRDAVDGPQGWVYCLELFAAYATA
jgi:hypothetical protein